MKQLILLTAFIISIRSTAQITLEHSYGNIRSFTIQRVENDGQKYIGIDTISQQVYIYNDNHSLWKMIPTNPATGFASQTANYTSRKLFDNDGDIEIFVSYFNSTTGKRMCRVLNDDGSTLFTIDDCLMASVAEVNGSWKLIAYMWLYPYYQAVYSLPGQYLGVKAPSHDENEISIMIYPNPMDNVATVRYELPVGVHQAGLNIYSVGGRLVRSYQVTDQFKDILIRKDELAPGSYYYKLAAPGLIETTKAFVIQ